MKRLLIVFVVLMFVVVGCGGGEAETAVSLTDTPIPPTNTPLPPTPTPVPPTQKPEPTAVPPVAEPETVDLAALEDALQAIVDEQVAAGFPGVILMVDAPDMNFTWQGAGGMADVAAGIPMKPNTPFRIASISKMLAATVVLRLAEEGMLNLDDPISQYLDTAVTDLLNGPEGEPYGEMITIRQLLSHTSGVADYYSPTDEASGPDEFADIFVNNPEKVWEPVEAIAFSTNAINPQFAPGEKWDYSNTNFILVGLIVEKVTGMKLGEAYQNWLFAPLGMADTFLAQTGDPRMEGVSHIFYDDLDVTGYASLSWMWGSGGVVTTVNDLNQFMWAWVDDEIFTNPASKEAMTQWTSMSSAGYDNLYYGLGIVDIDFGAMGAPEIDEIMGHNGMWNGFVYYWPKQNLVISGTLNQAYPENTYTGPVSMTMETILAHVATE